LRVKINILSIKMKQIVVVTGGGTGIGRATAARFAADGDTVVIAGRRANVLEEAASGTTIRWRPCDVTDTNAVASFVSWLLNDVGEWVDVLVNNAGGTGSLAEDAGLEEAAEYAREMLAANLFGAYLMTHALKPHSAAEATCTARPRPASSGSPTRLRRTSARKESP
jgi:3-oxoacyl-[acyl-carrier protein] reductase